MNTYTVCYSLPQIENVEAPTIQAAIAAVRDAHNNTLDPSRILEITAAYKVAK